MFILDVDASKYVEDKRDIAFENCIDQYTQLLKST